MTEVYKHGPSRDLFDEITTEIKRVTGIDSVLLEQNDTAVAKLPLYVWSPLGFKNIRAPKIQTNHDQYIFQASEQQDDSFTRKEFDMTLMYRVVMHAPLTFVEPTTPPITISGVAFAERKMIPALLVATKNMVGRNVKFGAIPFAGTGIVKHGYTWITTLEIDIPVLNPDLLGMSNVESATLNTAVWRED